MLYLDHAQVLRDVLPGHIPVAAEGWEIVTPGVLWAEWEAALEVGALRRGPEAHLTGSEMGSFWQDLVVLNESPRSQYDTLREAISATGGAPGNIAGIALTGHGFHGQHGRQWSVVPGNLHLSAVIACDLPARDFGPIMPALPAVAVAEAVSELGGGRLQPGIKWVNDILLEDKKVAGSLTFLRTEQSRIKAVVLGVGLNVAAMPELPGDPLALAPTSLQAVFGKHTPSLDKVLAEVMSALARRFLILQDSGPEDLLAAYRDLSAVVGRKVTVWPEGASRESVPLAQGEVVGIARDLGLEMRNEPTPVRAGRLVFDSSGTCTGSSA